MAGASTTVVFVVTVSYIMGEHFGLGFAPAAVRREGDSCSAIVALGVGVSTRRGGCPRGPPRWLAAVIGAAHWVVAWRAPLVVGGGRGGEGRLCSVGWGVC